ncbi:retinoblastoma binding protein 4, putative [Ichthyophthirius multifiliis]|uniref:Retinoblastoma binding protein 4, putative n=1 Tax=Ichthyophthirius multifiliis TaxID=5932 RepID=G0QIT4_ICHMU|nr:retinoblastoma binding protein 4, putative [Ichthyophthirius multifiliis]EGR34820.1 retinoblastoma binding protein 4, putative [Ichthyophthirius multifiliis]|eukprot:XP_004040124.1 retinoblastoma binding protein 4, putative [Ichthyophthirius multifiliis]
MSILFFYFQERKKVQKFKKLLENKKQYQENFFINLLIFFFYLKKNYKKKIFKKKKIKTCKKVKNKNIFKNKINKIKEQRVEIDDNQQINEEYKIWKRNTPFLYDNLLTHELEWPSMSIQWFPDNQIDDEGNFSIHKLLITTHTSDQDKEYLIIGKVKLPLENTPIDITEYQLDASEIGQMGLASGQNKIEIETKILHEGESNRARYMPQKPNIIASKLTSGKVHIFDSTQVNNEQVSPLLILYGHSQEGFGLSWNPIKQGLLLSGGYDKKIIVWDVEKENKEALIQIDFHKNQIDDVAWHFLNEELFASCSNDKTIALWDLRQKNNAGCINPTNCTQAHAGEIYSIDFNQFNDFLFITSSEDQTVGFWDMRNTSKRLHTFEGHNDSVLKCQWSPFNSGIFASCSVDRRVMIWDILRCGQKISNEDLQDGPPELLFIHGGHRNKVLDFSWNLNENYFVASVEDSNILQVWQMAKNIYEENEEGDNNNQNQIVVENNRS